MRVLILYETRRGFTLTVARAIRDELQGRGTLATTAPLRSVDDGTVVAAAALIVGTWVKGAIVAGVGPAPGVQEGIARLPSLEGKPAAVFCTCDVAPRNTLDVLAAWLRRRGAEVTVGETFKRRKSIRQVPRFVDVVLEAFARAQANA
jgi:menaquinone-dependent protoporphyrinogen IX oxidase